MKFDGLLHKTIGELFYTASNFVHHFKSIGEFKLELQSGNAQFGSKSVIFKSRVTLKLDGWTWKTIGHLFYTMLSFVHHFKAISEFNLNYSPETLNLGRNQQFFVPCDLQIWWMILKNNRAPLLYYVRQPSFVHHFTAISEFKLELQSGKAQFGSKSAIFLSRMTLKNNRAPLLYYTKHCASFQSRQ